jgi:DNA adenine methylase
MTKKPLSNLNDGYLRTQDAARLLGYTAQHTRLLVRQGKIRAEKLGRDWLVVRESVAEYQAGLAFCEEPPAPVVPSAAIVNVASVPLRSPFRYPGGKTWLVPLVRQWLGRPAEPFSELIEPFAGGGIVALTAVFEALVNQATLIELDEDVAAVWETILNGNGRWLAEAIASFDLTPENVRQALARTSASRRQMALATIIRNRVNRGGILAPGAGVVKNGENGRGIRSRWYPETLRKRILAIVERQGRFAFERGDGIEAIKKRQNDADLAFFVDPPYTVAGRRLYRCSEIDHGELFRTVAGVAGDFLMTYDDAPEIRGLARKHGLELRRVPMKSTHHARKMELLIGRDLSWLDA